VLDHVSFDVHAGEILGIVGRNGAGKTTLVEILQGLRRRDGGTVEVAGLDPARDSLRGIVGSQLQACALPAHLRVDEALRLFARLAGDGDGWMTLRDDWDLARLGRRPYGALSGGEQQRLFVALALLGSPRVVFLDEVTRSLDVAARRETWRLIKRVRDRGLTVVLVTHDLDEAERLCDRVVVIDRGRVAASGGPVELVTAHRQSVLMTFSGPADVLARVADLPGVHEVSHDGTRSRVRGTAESVVTVAAELALAGLAPRDFSVVRPSLDDVFVELTSRPSIDLCDALALAAAS
jgi:ABC-2 type transport system ATP-binding protein